MSFFIYNLIMNFTTLLLIFIFFGLVILTVYFLIKEYLSDALSWKEKAKLEEKELRQSLLIVKSINQFNHWIFKYDDEEFVKHYRNDNSGSVSNDRLVSLKLYDQFVDLGDSFFKIKDGIYNLPTSFFSKASLTAKEEIEKIEVKKKLLLHSLKRQHITSTEAILSIRNSMKNYYRLIMVPLAEIANLDMQSIHDENNESLSIIDQEKTRIKMIKNTKMGSKTTESVYDWSKKKANRTHKRVVKESKRIINDERAKISNRHADLKLRSYLIKHADVQKTAREYLKYLHHIMEQLSPEQLAKIEANRAKTLLNV